MRPRVLFVTYNKPWPPEYGTAIRVLAQLEALESMAEVDILILGSLGNLGSEPFYRDRNIVGQIPWLSGMQSNFLRYLPSRLREKALWSITYLPWYERILKGSIQIRQMFQEIATDSYDLIYFIRADSYWYLPYINQHKRVIVDIDDVQTLQAKTAIRQQTSWWKLLFLKYRYANLKRAESSLLRATSIGLVCSKNDAKLLGYPNIEVFPNPIPDHGQEKHEITDGDSKQIVFVGALKYRPNKEALLFFSRDVLPRIQAQLPDATLSAVGIYHNEDHGILCSIPGVELLGYVPEIQPILEGAAIVIAPLLEGLGTRIKIIEALSFGKPVVATHLGAHGIGIDEDGGLFREDDPSRMATICLDLMQNPAKRRSLGERGKQLVYELYGQNALNKRMQEILKHALGR